jgi:hypothetical protein
MRAPKTYLALPFDSVAQGARRALSTNAFGTEIARPLLRTPAPQTAFDVPRRSLASPRPDTASVPIAHRRISHRHR